MAAADSDFHALWMQDLDYPARLDRLFADSIWTAGVLGGSSFEVTDSAPAAMSVDVAAGVCVVAGGDQTAQGKYLVRKQTAETGLAIAAAPGSGQRNDLIVVEVRDPNATGPAGDDARLFVVQGTPSGSPVDPIPPDTCLVLARVRVPSGTGSIDSSLIDDLRVQADFAGQIGTTSLQDGAVTDVKIASVDGSKITTGTVAAARIANLDASKITTGTFDVARIPNLDAAKVASGRFVVGRLPTSGTANRFLKVITAGTNPAYSAIVAADVPNLNASKITAGTLPIARGGTNGTTTATALGQLGAYGKGTAAPAGNRITISASAPGGPANGDIWIRP